ncbi:MAG: efflux RND transporter permease subunit [Rhodoferax sp.]|nr:efflux RND transporter permease subunit [Rhodoferax sp.]
MFLTRISVNQPVFATMIMVALMVFGIYSFQRLPIENLPDVDFPVVAVVVSYPGASPEAVENDVIKPIEEAVNTISGIDTINATARSGEAMVILQFEMNVNSATAIQDVRDKMGAVQAQFPDAVNDPLLFKFDPAELPVISLAVSSETMSLRDLTALTDDVIQPRLSSVQGVGRASVVGGVPRQLNVLIDPDRLSAFGVGVGEVTAALRQENQDLPAGDIEQGREVQSIQVEGRIAKMRDFLDIIVARRGGQPVRLGDVAMIEDGEAEPTSLALLDGEQALAVDVVKTQGSNTVDVAKSIRAAVDDLMDGDLPEGVLIEVVRDNAKPVEDSYHGVQNMMVEGAGLAVLILFLFLNSWRSTVITGLTLPISIIGTMTAIYFLGFTLNMMTLMALSLAVGILIDDAIVVRENIMRHLKMGKSHRQAALDGTNEIGLAVLATTLSIVAVFLPVAFMEGILGRFFLQFGITVSVAVLISLFVSFTLDPMLSSVWHDPEIARHDRERGQHLAPVGFYDRIIGRVTGLFDRLQDLLSDTYQGALRWSLSHKLLTLLLAVGVFASSIFMVRLLGTEFVPKADFSETTLDFHTPVGSSLEVTEAKARQVEAIVRAMPEVRYTLVTINTGNAQGKMYASVYVRLVDRKDRTRSVDAMSALLRERLRQVAGITVTHVGLLDSVGGEKQVRFSIQGPDQAELERITVQVLDRIRAIPGLVDLDSSVKPNKPTLDVQVRRDVASDLGLSISQLGGALRTMVAGQTVGNWRASDDQTYDVNVRLRSDARNALQDLERLPFTVGSNPDGSMRIVRLNQLAEIRETTSPNQINRRDLTREVSVTANVYGRSAGEVSEDIRRIMDGVAMPPGYHYQFGGSTKNMAEAFGYAISALVMAIIFIYMILASQFKSFLQPLALMTSLPLTLIGVVLALMMFGSTLSMFSVIGVVMLMGLVTKNAILLVDFAIRARRDTVGDDGRTIAGLGRNEALLLAAKVRLRPILMTTLAMVFGMVPLAFALTEGSEMRAPMGQAVIGGVITSSLLTLVVVPVAYCYMDDLAQWGRRLLGIKAGAAQAPKIDSLT